MNPPRYDLRLKYDGTLRPCLSEEEVAHLMFSGEIDRHSPCAVTGSGQWRTVDDLLPLLKWAARTSTLSTSTSPWPGSHDLASVHASGAPESKQAAASPLRAGWICVGLGFGIAWIFPPAHAFYSVAIILAIVALCRMPPRYGLALLVCSFVGIGTSVAISLALGVSLLTTIAGSVSPPPRRPATASQTTPSPINLRAEEKSHAVRQLLEVPSTNVPTIDSTSVTHIRPNHPPPTPVPRPPEEVTIELGKWQSVPTRYGSLSVMIIDHGPVTFSVWANGSSNPRRLDKIKGFETTGTNITPIASLPEADVYYVDRISVSVGYCVLKIVPRG